MHKRTFTQEYELLVLLPVSASHRAVKVKSDPMVEHGTAYVIPNNETYTIDKTSEQKDAYIKDLEERLSKKEMQYNDLVESIRVAVGLPSWQDVEDAEEI